MSDNTFYADNVDADGVVWPTVGENIRRGKKEIGLEPAIIDSIVGAMLNETSSSSRNALLNLGLDTEPGQQSAEKSGGLIGLGVSQTLTATFDRGSYEFSTDEPLDFSLSIPKISSQYLNNLQSIKYVMFFDGVAGETPAGVVYNNYSININYPGVSDYPYAKRLNRQVDLNDVAAMLIVLETCLLKTTPNHYHDLIRVRKITQNKTTGVWSLDSDDYLKVAGDYEGEGKDNVILKFTSSNYSTETEAYKGNCHVTAGFSGGI